MDKTTCTKIFGVVNFRTIYTFYSKTRFLISGYLTDVDSCGQYLLVIYYTHISISSIKSEVYFFQWLTAYMILPVFNHQCWLPGWLLWLCGGACTVGCWAVWGWLRWCWLLGCLWGCAVMQ